MQSWRSLLFVPADRPDLADKAAAGEADAVILDLEDAVAPARKAAARAALARMAAVIANAGKDVLVRINADAETSALDLESLKHMPVAALVAPKATSRLDIETRLAAMHAMLGFGAIIALIESPLGVLAAAEIAATPGVVALALGSEDFSLALGAPPTPASLDLPCRMLALAAAAYDKPAYAVPISIAAFREEESVRDACTAAAAAGVAGMLCIHPAQIRIANATFSASPEAVAQAEAVLAAWRRAAHNGDAVTSLEGRMIDKPVADAALRTLRRVGRTPAAKA